MKSDFQKLRYFSMLAVTLLLAAICALMSAYYLTMVYHNYFTEKRIERDERYGPLDGKSPQRIIVILQGTGMNATDLIPIARQMAPYFTDTMFVAPYAVYMGHKPGTRKWYLTMHRTEKEVYAYGVDTSRHALLSFIESLHHQTGVPYSRIGVLGISQGGSMGLQTALYGPEPLWGVVNYAGILFAEKQDSRFMFLPVQTEHTDRTKGLDIADIKTPLLLFHGTADDIVDPQHSEYAMRILGPYTNEIELVSMPNAGHEITPVSLQKAAAFFATHE